MRGGPFAIYAAVGLIALGSAAKAEPASPKLSIVFVRADGALLLDGRAVDAATIRRRLGCAKIELRAEKAIRYDHFMSAINALQMQKCLQVGLFVEAPLPR